MCEPNARGRRVEVHRDQGAGQPVQHAPLERQDAEEIARNGPMGAAKNDIRLDGDGCGFDRGIGRTLAVSHNDDPFAGQLVKRFERRNVNHLALELIAAVEKWDVWRL